MTFSTFGFANAPAVRRTLAVASAATSIACGNAPSAQSPTSSGAATAACVATTEVAALSCSGGAVTRSGDTLRIRLTSQGAKTFVNVGGEADAAYEYRGRLGPGEFHLLERFGGEHPPYYVLVDPHSGVDITLVGRPIVSPDGARFAVAISEWDCADSPNQRLAIWRFADRQPTQEWDIAPLRCEGNGTPAGWAAVEPSWRTPDTLGFVRIEQPSQRRSAALAVRDSHAWRLVTTPH
jgi:hypothetical protein